MFQRFNVFAWIYNCAIRDFIIPLYSPICNKQGGGEVRIRDDPRAPAVKIHRLPNGQIRKPRVDIGTFRRAHIDDLESRRDWATSDFDRILGGVQVWIPLGARCREIELTAMCSRNPCFSIIRWEINGCHLAVAIRSSPPYLDWARGDSGPITWRAAVTHHGRQPDNDRTRAPAQVDPSSSSQVPPSDATTRSASPV